MRFIYLQGNLKLREFELGRFPNKIVIPAGIAGIHWIGEEQIVVLLLWIPAKSMRE
ncbi:MAG: hypothetical protein P8184_19330 [Calditrichia bacterium]